MEGSTSRPWVMSTLPEAPSIVRHILAHEQFLAKVLGRRVDGLDSCRDGRERSVDEEEMEDGGAGKVIGVVLLVDRNADVLNDRTLPQPGTLKGMDLRSNRGWTAFTEQQAEQELRRGNCCCCCCSGRTDLVICERNILRMWGVGKAGSVDLRSPSTQLRAKESLLMAAVAIVIFRFAPQFGRRRMKRCERMEDEYGGKSYEWWGFCADAGTD